jgi:hypothetical protein
VKKETPEVPILGTSGALFFQTLENTWVQAQPAI